MGSSGGVVADTGWILPTPATDITVGATFSHLGYRVIGRRLVINIGFNVANPATDKLVFTLPVGFRPAVQSGRYIVLGGMSGQLRAYPNGEIRTNSAGSVAAGEVSLVLA